MIRAGGKPGDVDVNYPWVYGTYLRVGDPEFPGRAGKKIVDKHVRDPNELTQGRHSLLIGQIQCDPVFATVHREGK
ncbi:hypothetical protein J7K76_04655 [Candidatus Bipolaricaulota bacterium]|nr:hypothetical protein [Candidatus Bipolaricaulota bacterium]